MKTILAAALAAGLGLGATSAGAVTLTFSGDICGGGTSCSNNAVIDDSYGDIAGQLDVIYTRDIGETGDNRLRWYGPNYSDLAGVAYGGVNNSTGPAEIFLKPLSGYQVTLSGFDLGAWPTTTRNTQVTILGGNGDILAALAPYTINGLAHTSLAFDFTRADGIRIQWGPDNYDVGIDNIAFNVSPISVSAVPEPATWAMMITGFGLAGAALRRRTARAIA